MAKIFSYKFSLIVILFFQATITCYSQTKINVRMAMNLARTKNINVKTYGYIIPRERADIITAGLRPNPVFNQQSLFLLDKRYLTAIEPNANMFTSPYSRQTWYQLTKNYQIAGQRKGKINFQTKEAEYYEKDVDEYTYNTTYQTAQKWLEAWYADVNLRIVLLGKKNIDSILSINKMRFAKGVIPQEEYLRNKIIAEKYNTLFTSSVQSYKTEIQKLQFLINTNDSIGIDPDDFFFNKLLDYKNTDSLINYAFMHRPDIITDKAFQKSTTANVQLQKTLAYPLPEFGLVMNPQNIQPYAGWYLQIPIPVFSKNQGEIKKASINNLQAQSQIEATKMLIETEITYSLQEYEVNKSNVQRNEEIVENANEVLRIIQYSYLRGGMNFLDFLNGQNTWFDAQKSYNDAIMQYRKSYLQLLYVTGLLASNN